MRKLVSLSLALMLTLSLTACGPVDDKTGSVESEPVQGGMDVVDSITDIDVDDDVFDVEITIPADLVGEDTTQATLNDGAGGKSYRSATLNEDGSVLYVMSHRQHRAMMDDLEKSIRDELTNMVESEQYPRFMSIDANKDFTEYTVEVAGSELDFSESLSTLAFHIYTTMYHTYQGTDPESIAVVVTYLNAETGETIQESNSADMGSET